MAQYFTDYSDTTVGQQPADTTLKRNAVSGDYTRQDDDGAAVLRFLHSGTVNARGLDYNPIDSSGVTEVFTTLRDTGPSNPTSGRLIAFATDGPDNEYGCWASPNTSFDSVIYRRVNGSFTSLGSAEFSFATTEYVNVRFRVTPGSPNRLQLRVWKEADPEPATWLLDVTDSNLSLTAGWVGHIGFDDNVSIFFKQTGIGTDGDAAPTSASGTTFNQAVAGSITSTGTVASITTFRETLAGSISATGNLARKISTSFEGSITATGSVLKKIIRDLAGSITSTGTLASELSSDILKTVTGSITATGALTKKVFRSLSGSVSSTGSITKKTSTDLDGSISMSGDPDKGIAQDTSGSITPTGTLNASDPFVPAPDEDEEGSGSFAQRLRRIYGTITRYSR